MRFLFSMVTSINTTRTNFKIFLCKRMECKWFSNRPRKSVHLEAVMLAGLEE